MDRSPVGSGDELGDAVMGDKGTCHRKHKSTDHGGKGLRFSVAIGMLRVRGFCGILEGPPDEERAKEVEQGLDAIGDQGIGSTDHATGDLPGREDQIQKNSGQDGAPPLCGLELEITVGHKIGG